MNQVYTKTIVGEFNDNRSPLGGKTPKPVFEEYKHCYPLKDDERVQVVIKEIMAAAQTI